MKCAQRGGLETRNIFILRPGLVDILRSYL